MKIVSVSSLALHGAGTQSPIVGGLAGQVVPQERTEVLLQGNEPRLSVLRAESGGLFYMNAADLPVQMEPGHSGLDDLVLSHSSVKPGHEDESQVVGGRVGEDLVSLVGGAKEFPGRSVNLLHDQYAAGETQRGGSFAKPSAPPFDLVHDAKPVRGGPGKERGDGAHVDLGGGLGNPRLQLGVMALDFRQGDVGCDSASGGGELGEGRAHNASTLSGKNVLFHFPLDVAQGVARQIALRPAKFMDSENVALPLDGNGGVGGLEIDVFSLAAAHDLQPVVVTVQAKAFHGVFIGSWRHGCAIWRKLTFFPRPYGPTQA